MAVNEAIELGKRYSTQNSGAFVNGILDKIMNTRRPGADAAAAPATPGLDEELPGAATFSSDDL